MGYKHPLECKEKIRIFKEYCVTDFFVPIGPKSPGALGDDNG
jgi:hypothetical protein